MANLRCLLGRHRRSAADRFRDRDGLLKSKCVRCGVRMVRARGGRRWIAHAPRDLRAQLAPLRALADRLTGPVLFLIGMAALLGLALWVNAPKASPAVNAAAGAR